MKEMHGNDMEKSSSSNFSRDDGLCLAGCGSEQKTDKAANSGDKVHLTVFAAASMTETMTKIAEQYQKEHPNVEISFNFDSSGTLKKQIQNGADVDLFISAAQKQNESARCCQRRQG